MLVLLDAPEAKRRLDFFAVHVDLPIAKAAVLVNGPFGSQAVEGVAADSELSGGILDSDHWKHCRHSSSTLPHAPAIFRTSLLDLSANFRNNGAMAKLHKFDPRTPATSMLHVRRAWVKKDGSFAVISRDGKTTYRVTVAEDGMSATCTCPAALHGRDCWHCVRALKSALRRAGVS